MYSASLDSICEPGRGCRHWIRLDDLAQFVFLELHAPHQLAVVAAAEQVEVVGYQAQRFVQPGRGGRQLAQLQQQALAQVAGADAGGFQLLDAAQHDFHFVELDVQFRIDGGEDFFEGLFEVAIVVDAIDDGHRDHPIGVRHRCQVDLPEQVAVQALAAAGARGEVPLVIVVAGQAAGAGLVDVFPGGIHRQLAGYAFAPLVVVEAFDAGRGAFLEGLSWGALAACSAPSARGSLLSKSSPSSWRSSMGLDSSASWISCWRSRVDSWRRRMACCSCGVIVSCWPILRTSDGFMAEGLVPYSLVPDGTIHYYGCRGGGTARKQIICLNFRTLPRVALNKSSAPGGTRGCETAGERNRSGEAGGRARRFLQRRNSCPR